MLEINKAHFICGILGEIEAAKIPVFVGDGTFSALLTIKLAEGFRFRKARVQLSSDQPNQIECKADYFGNTICFVLEKEENSTDYSLPKVIHAESWNSQKLVLPCDSFPCEICFPRGYCHGFVTELTPSTITVVADYEIDSTANACDCKVIFRNQSSEKAAFQSTMKLDTIHEDDDCVRMVFSNRIAETLTNRIESPVEGIGIDFISEYFGDYQFSGWIKLQTLGLSSFSGFFIANSPSDFLINGINLTARFPNIRFTLHNESDGLCVFKVLDSNEEWLKFVQTHTDPHFGNKVYPEHLGRLFAESTLLKKLRRKLFGAKIAKHIPHAGKSEINPDLSLRYVAFSETSALPSLHSGRIRFSDTSWFMQEGSSGTFPATCDIFDHAIKSFTEQRIQKKNSCRRLFTIFSANIPTQAKRGEFFSDGDKDTKLKACHLITSECIQKIPADFSSLLQRNVDDISQKDRIEIAQNFHPEILALLDYWNPTECNLSTNLMLRSISDAFETKLILVLSDDGKPLGLVYRIFSWLASNITGVMGSQFIFPIKTISQNDLMRLIVLQSRDNKMTIGSDDLLVVGASSDVGSWESAFELITIQKFLGSIMFFN